MYSLIPVVFRRVRGASMAPTLVDGDYVIALRRGVLFRRLVQPRIGDVFVVEPCRDPIKRSAIWQSLGSNSMVKRITQRSDGNGASEPVYAIAGDNSMSMAFEQFGNITDNDLCARVVVRVPKVGRAALIGRHRPRPSSRVADL